MHGAAPAPGRPRTGTNPRTFAPTARATPGLELRLPLEFRLCEEGDLPALEWFGLFREHRQVIREAFARQQAGANLMLLGLSRGAPLAQAWIDLERRRRDATAYFWAVRVFPWFEGLGLGRRLMSEAEGLARARGFSRAELGVETGNVRALTFYRKIGYRRVGELHEDFRYQTPEGRRQSIRLQEHLLAKELAPGAPENLQPIP